jgi:hypothetical protein
MNRPEGLQRALGNPIRLNKNLMMLFVLHILGLTVGVLSTVGLSTIMGWL